MAHKSTTDKSSGRRVTVDERNVFRPANGWQVRAWRDQSLIILLEGTAGSGKSRLALEKLHAFLCHYPNATGLALRKDKVSARRSIVPFLQAQVMGSTDWGRFYKTDGLFQYNNGSQLWIAGMNGEQQREAIRSIGQDGSADIVFMEEGTAFTREDFSELMARLRGKASPWLQMIVSTNPDSPKHWIYTDLIKGQKASVYTSRATDNPYLPAQYFDALDMLTGVRRQRLKLGKWVSAEGGIYSEYNESIHVVDRFEPPLEGRYLVGVDFGFRNPTSVSLYYVDPNDVVYQYRQIYRSRMTVEELCPYIAQMVGDRQVEAWLCDHDAENRATLERHLGIETTAANKAVTMGIELVKSRLKSKRLFFMSSAVDYDDQALGADDRLINEKKPLMTVDEITGYSWSPSTVNGKEVPLKVDDHGVDELRYVVAYLDSGSIINLSDYLELGSLDDYKSIWDIQ